jgi:hypothetical protein
MVRFPGRSARLLFLALGVVPVKRARVRVIEILLALGEITSAQVGHLVVLLLLALGEITDVALGSVPIAILPSCKVGSRRALSLFVVVAHVYLLGRLARTN